MLKITSLSLNHCQRFQPGYGTGDPGSFHGFDDGLYFFVGKGSFLSQTTQTASPDQDTLLFQLVLEDITPYLLSGLGTAHGPTSAMASRAKGLAHSTSSARQNVAGCAHRTGHQHRLAHIPVIRRNFGVAGTKSAGRPFAMDTNLLHTAVNLM
jgi:hypothetical protein